MADQSQTKFTNYGSGLRPVNDATTIDKKKKHKDVKRMGEFEFCKVCRINHNNGRSHNYFPGHTKSLSSILSRFQKKVSNVRSSLKNPSLLQDGADDDRMWCNFCEIDMDDIGSSFVRANAIKHLASEDHLKNLKHFLWKYSGGMNKVDIFRIKEEEVTKWEKRCATLKDQSVVSTKKTVLETMHEVSTDIRPETHIMNSFDKYNGHFLESNLSNVVSPLQYSTLENHQVSLSEIPRAESVGSMAYAASPGLQFNSFQQTSRNLAARGSNQVLPHSSSTNRSAQSSTVNSPSVSGNLSMGYETSYLQGFQNLTQASPGGYNNNECGGGNVHTGAPPPWFEAVGEATTNQDDQMKVLSAHLASTIPPPKRSSKLNPKRVGAAWAERRKIEMEMEKRGEVVAAASVSDVNWLPNFGRVWQSGSRKESKKEFEKEKRKFPLSESVSKEGEAPVVKIQPYISKRMRADPGNDS